MRAGRAAIFVGSALVALAVSSAGAGAQPVGVARPVGEVIVEPQPDGIGALGWRVDVVSDGLTLSPLVEGEARGPILGSRRSVQRRGATVGPIRGFVVTSGEVSAISVDGGAPIPTTALDGLPWPAGIAAYEVPAGTALTPRNTVSVSLLALGAAGTPLRQAVPVTSSNPGAALATATWAPPARPVAGVCALATSSFPGLAATTSTTIVQLRRAPAEDGEADTVCAETTFVYDGATGEPLTASLVIDAVHPGMRPAGLPGLVPSIAGGPAQVSRWPEGGVAAAPAPGAWMIVTGGRSEAQRLSLLAHLVGKVNLPHMHPRRAGGRRRRAR
jgi:hypothetical protein